MTPYIVHFGQSRYRVIGHGCATRQPNCPNEPHALTVLGPLDKHNEPRYQLTLCLDARQCEVER